MSTTSFISQIFEFLGELFNSLDKGTLFFGSVWDFIRYAIDIALVTFLFYTLLVFIRQTRDWQLIKGIVECDKSFQAQRVHHDEGRTQFLYQRGKRGL